MNEKINKLATQHEVIGVKADCNYFSNIGNLCSRVENGMMRCDEYLECEFKYIDALKEENERLKEELASFMNGDYCAEGCKKMNNAFRHAHKGILEENEKLKKTIEKIKALNLFSLNNSREKIAEINAIINDLKESEQQ